jgi:hypothetical protein
VTRSTKAMIAHLDSVSLHDGSGSSIVEACADTKIGESADKIGSALKAENSPRRLTRKNEAFEDIAGVSFDPCN